MEAIVEGIVSALTLYNFLAVAAGVAIGITVGAMPGLNSPLAIAVAVPLTFTMEPLAAIGMLVGVMKGGHFGGAIAATLLNTPGEPSAAATALDAHPLAMHQRKPRKALKMSLYSSVFGDTCSDATLILVAAPLALLAEDMGRVEQTAIIGFSFVLISVLAGNSMTKGFIATLLGVLCAQIGTIEAGYAERFTFSIDELADGLPIAGVAIGILALPEVLQQLVMGRIRAADTPVIEESEVPADRRVSLSEFWGVRWVLARAAAIGTIIGAMPGVGSTVAAFMSYGVTKRMSKDPSRFGKGAIEGVAATEAANSAVVGANLIPLLTLGIPGNVSAALLVGAFVIHGVEPGPGVFKSDAILIYGLFASMVIANVMNLTLGQLGLRVFVLAMRVPGQVLYPIVLMLCVVGVYLSTNGLFGVGVMIVFGVLGYIMRRLDYSVVCFIIGFVLGDSFESNLRGAVTILYRDPLTMLLDHPFAIALFLITPVVAWLMLRARGGAGPAPTATR